MTIQNEAEAADVGWEKCVWTPEFQAQFVKNHLGPVLQVSCLLPTLLALSLPQTSRRLTRTPPHAPPRLRLQADHPGTKIIGFDHNKDHVVAWYLCRG